MAVERKDRAVAGSLYPLTAGERRRYRTAHGVWTLENLPRRQLEGEPLAVQRLDMGRSRCLYYLRADTTGVAEVAIQGARDPSPSRLDPPAYYFRLPLVEGDSWPVVTRSFYHPAVVPITLEARVERLDTSLTVPAGTFDGVVAVLATGRARPGAELVALGRIVHLAVEWKAWYAPGVGLLKKSWREASELVPPDVGWLCLELLPPVG